MLTVSATNPRPRFCRRGIMWKLKISYNTSMSCFTGHASEQGLIVDKDVHHFPSASAFSLVLLFHASVIAPATGHLACGSKQASDDSRLPAPYDTRDRDQVGTDHLWYSIHRKSYSKKGVLARCSANLPESPHPKSPGASFTFLLFAEHSLVRLH